MFHIFNTQQCLGCYLIPIANDSRNKFYVKRITKEEFDFYYKNLQWDKDEKLRHLKYEEVNPVDLIGGNHREQIFAEL